MELRHLRYFVAVAEAMSFTKAAAALRLAQPSLTRQVRNLEDEIGVALFDRIHNRVTLTEEGHRFLGDARKILTLCAESVAAVQRMRRRGGAQLNIGYVADLHHGLLPATLEAFRKLRPQVVLNLFDMSSADQIRALDAFQIDLGFIGLSPAIPVAGLSIESVARDSMVVALPTRHPLGKNPKVLLAHLAPHFFIGMASRTHPGAREWLLQVCRLAGFEGQILQEADTEATAIKFVAGGLGVALLPEQSIGLPHEGVIFRPLSPPLYRSSTIAWRSDNSSRELKEYVDIVKGLSRPLRGKPEKKDISFQTTSPAVKKRQAERSRRAPFEQ